MSVHGEREMSGERILTDYTPQEVMESVATIASAIAYLSYSWGADTPRDQMQANVDARAILIRHNIDLIDEAQMTLEATRPR